MKNQLTNLLIIITLLIFASCNSNKQCLETNQTAEDENTYELSTNQFDASEMKLGKLEIYVL